MNMSRRAGLSQGSLTQVESSACGLLAGVLRVLYDFCLTVARPVSNDVLVVDFFLGCKCSLTSRGTHW